MNRLIYILIICLGLVSESYAEQIENDLKSNEIYTSPVVKQINETAINANKSIKNSLKGKNISIPASWKLINVIYKKTDEYVLFFQNVNGEIHSFGIKSNGSLTGEDVIFIPIEKK